MADISKIKLPGETSARDVKDTTARSGLAGKQATLVDSGTGQNIKTFDTSATTAQSTNSSESILGTGKITLHKVSKTGSYNDLLNKPAIPTDTNQTVKTSNVTFADNDVVEIAGANNITATGNSTNKKITLGVASGYSIPSDTDQTAWSAKQAALDTQTAYTSKGSATKVPQITTNTLGQVTGITEVTITQPTVNNATLTIKAAGTSKGTFTANASSDVEINITASDLGLSSAMKFLGVTTTQISDGSTTNPITVDGKSVTADAGDVALYGSLEFVWAGSAWELLGQDGSYALNSVTITGTGVLGGGGTLESNRTITHNEVLGTAKTTADVYKIKIDKYGHISEATSAGLATVATSGSYSDLSGKPTIPATNVIPATTTASKLLLSTTTSGTAKWSDFSTAGFLKTTSSGVVSSQAYTEEEWTFTVEGSDTPVTKTVFVKAS